MGIQFRKMQDTLHKLFKKYDFDDELNRSDFEQKLQKIKMMTIRQVQKEDNLALARMIRGVFEEFNAPIAGTVYSDPTTDELYELFQIKKAVLWVAEENKNMLGCCGIYPTKGLPEDVAELVKFYLPKESRGKGLGKILMEKSSEL